jgi:hypothetical protein
LVDEVLSCLVSRRGLRSAGDRASGCSFNRYYDPATGQFLSVDPLVNETGAPYSYAGDDPVDEADPTGLCPAPEEPPDECDGLGPDAPYNANTGEITDTAESAEVALESGNVANENAALETIQREQAAAAAADQAADDQADEAAGPTGTGEECVFSREGNLANAAEGEADAAAAPTVSQFIRNMSDADIIQVTDEPATSAARAYRGGTSVNIIYKYEDSYFERHIVYNPAGQVIHDTFKPWAPGA